MSTPRITLRLIQIPSAAPSCTSSYVKSTGAAATRGVLVSMPPTLNALKTAAMDEALTNSHMKQLMAKAKAKRKQERIESRAKKSKIASASAATFTERKTADHRVDADSVGMENGEDEEKLDDSEEEDAAKLPAYWPFSWRFSIDGGEIRSAESYSFLVRDRDCIDAELLIHEARGKGWLPVDEYCEPEVIELEEKESTQMDTSENVPTRTTPPLHSPLVPIAHATNPHAHQPSPRVSTVPSGAERERNGTTTAARTNAPTSSSVKTTVPAKKPPMAIEGGKANFRCCSNGCDNSATLGPCPNCAEIGQHNSYFCSQQCFTRNYQIHSAQYHPATA